MTCLRLGVVCGEAQLLELGATEGRASQGEVRAWLGLGVGVGVGVGGGVGVG